MDQTATPAPASPSLVGGGDLEEAGGRAGVAAGRGSRPWWGRVLLLVALLAILVAAAVGVRGLLGNPVRSEDASGAAHIAGDVDPLACPSAAPCSQGYVHDGARSVFVVFPSSCPQPRVGHVDITARRDPSLGKATYRAGSCA